MSGQVRRRAVVLGVDGATFDLVGPWASEGVLPTFARLLQNGCHGMLKSVANQRSASAWTSLATGKNPGKHGIFDFWHRVPDSYSIQFINGSVRAGSALWDYVGQAGGKVIVVNVPMTYPAKPVNGILIAGMDAPGVGSRHFSFPPNIIDEVLHVNGKYEIEPGVTSLTIAGRYREAIEAVYETATLRYKAASYLMTRYPWDLCVVVFRETDPIQHTFWKFMDPSYPDHDFEKAILYGSVIQDVYRHIDSLVGQLLESVDPDTAVFLVSDHGFGINPGGNEHLPTWLASMGMLQFASSAAKHKWSHPHTLLRPVVSQGLSVLYQQVQRRTTRRTKEILSRWFPWLRERVQGHLTLGGIDWSRTVAFADGVRENIWINLKGREPQGIVESAQEYEELLRRLSEELLQATDVKTGQLVVERVLRGKEAYHGDYLSQAPDLIVEWKGDVVISGITSPGVCKPAVTRGHVTSRVPSEESRYISGYHRAYGILMCAGRGMKHGYQVSNAEIVDIAPTVLHTMGLPVPSDMDGKVLSEIFLESTHEPVQVVNATARDGTRDEPETRYSEEDARTIEQRLRGLGYL